MNIPPADTPRQNACLSDTQLAMVQQWAKSDFISDFDPARCPPQRIEDVAVPDQPEMLDRASLEFCLADAFHPGCEMTWPMRNPLIYMSPFRVAHAKAGWVEPSYGSELILDTLILPNGPIQGGQVPGGLSRWMAVPWQTDSASCRSGYQTTYDPYVPTFWPARVPNQVLSHKNYEIVMDKNRPMAERMAAFANRAAWIRPLGSKSYTDQINNMIYHYGDMGVVEQLPGPTDAAFPNSMQVENLPSHTIHQLARLATTEHGVDCEESPYESDRLDLTGIDKVKRFPHGLRR